jgi:hypothetical protein
MKARDSANLSCETDQAWVRGSGYEAIDLTYESPASLLPKLSNLDWSCAVVSVNIEREANLSI